MYNEAFQILLLEILFHYTQTRNALITMGDLVEGQIIKNRQYEILKETYSLQGTSNMIFSSSTYEQFKQRFYRKEFGSQRYGQAFHDFMQLDKSNDKEFCNKLYNAKDEEAKQLIEQHIDINQ